MLKIGFSFGREKEKGQKMKKTPCKKNSSNGYFPVK